MPTPHVTPDALISFLYRQGWTEMPTPHHSVFRMLIPPGGKGGLPIPTQDGADMAWSLEMIGRILELSPSELAEEVNVSVRLLNDISCALARRSAYLMRILRPAVLASKDTALRLCWVRFQGVLDLGDSARYKNVTEDVNAELENLAAAWTDYRRRVGAPE